MKKHRKNQLRWRKFSIGLDPNNVEIVAHKLTDSDVGDPDQVAPLLEASGVRHFFADGTYDKIRFMRLRTDIRPMMMRRILGPRRWILHRLE